MRGGARQKTRDGASGAGAGQLSLALGDRAGGVADAAMGTAAAARDESGWVERLAEGAVVLRGFGSAPAAELWAALQPGLQAAPLRHMRTPGGRPIQVAMSSCGALGWISDAGGYRYSGVDPSSGRAWPAMPESLLQLATRAAERAGFGGFVPDACLINRYEAGTGLSLHQDRDERDFRFPIVSVSLGVDATFLFGGLERGDRPLRTRLVHGDVVVWGGAARLRFHGVAPLRAGQTHPLLGPYRYNLTLRRAG